MPQRSSGGTDRASTHVVALRRDGHNYVLLFDTAGAGEACRQLGRWAADPELRFDWGDAADLGLRIRRLVGET